MELYQLRTFVTVAQEGHLTRASERLHISQPAVSAQIKALEEELGVSLFERKAGGVALTKAGHMLMPQAEKILAAANDLLIQAKNLQGEIAGKVRFGTVIDPEFLRLGDFLNNMLEHYPLIEIEVHHGVSGWVMNCVRDGDLDAGFFFGNRHEPNVAEINLRRMTYRIVAPPAWKEKVEFSGWKEIAALPWVWTPKLSSLHQIATEMFAEQNLEPVKVIEADNEAVISNLVTSGVGLSLMREDRALEAETAGELVLWEEAKTETTLSFIYLVEREQDPVIRAMIDVIREIWKIGD